MKKGILWMMLSFLLVAALVLASCGEAVPGEQEEEEEEEEEVQYGGTLTIARPFGDPSNADQMEMGWPTELFVPPVLDFLLTGDIDKYGPRGTNEFAFRTLYGVSAKYSGGGVTESWEMSADGRKVTFHIRPGVYWAAIGKEHVMESREFTAYDVEFSLNRFYDNTEWVKTACPVERMYAVDDYTFVIEMPAFSSMWPYRFGAGWTTSLYAPEVVAAGASDWNNLVGTGPFMVKEYIPGSALIYERNPIYYGRTVINGVEYQLPFVNKLVFSIINDESTRIAALRTGQVDLMGGSDSVVFLRYKDSLRATCPDLEMEEILGTVCWSVGFFYKQEGLPPEIVTSKEVRRALMIGLDLEAIAKSLYGRALIHTSPVNPLDVDCYTPFDELPESSQELFVYDPVKARQMLADEGYPDPLGPLTLVMPVAGESTLNMDIASILEDQWAKIGVELDTRVMSDWAALGEWCRVEPGEVPHYQLHLMDQATASAQQNLGGRVCGGGKPGQSLYYVDRFHEGNRTIDEAARNAIYKEICLRTIDEVIYITLGTPYELICKWPWVKNYYGELDDSGHGSGHILSYIWIDRELKAKLGY